MAAQFTDFAVQYSFHQLWTGQPGAAVELLRSAAARTSPVPPPGRGSGVAVWYDPGLGLMLDQADYPAYAAWKATGKSTQFGE